ncbi:MAG: hypothetical protein KJP25_06125 [Gammaproteobacteria bacterium]|nr:hypothetical protein [Gammaproteobacteria bacterium]MBT8151572.1 hypothetical protein [Gammaproteobacteria bacterium]NND39061.1 hypothetical protein [Pseudomonadales bacterium]
MTIPDNAEAVLQSLQDIRARYETTLQDDPALANSDLTPLEALEALDAQMRQAVEGALAFAQDHPDAAEGIREQFTELAGLNRQLMQRIEQGRAEIARQLGKLGAARKGMREYSDASQL